MFDFRPVGYVIGLLVVGLGVGMLVPMALDLALRNGNAEAFGLSSFACLFIGACVALACRSGAGGMMETRQAFLVTFLVWVVLPLFGGLPFMLGAPRVGFTDASFEAVSGITTTGSSVLHGLEHLPEGVLLWRGLLNWVGGLGIAFIAMIFLPHLRVGGMQFFRAQGFDTLGKTMPRAVDIARGLLGVYVGLTLACGLTYSALGMTPLDAVVNAMATIATGGFSTADAGFGRYPGAPEYAGALFMILASLPYIRYMQLVAGHGRPLLRDVQVRAYVSWILLAVALVTAYRVLTSGAGLELAFRQALFNLVSIFSGTGFGTAYVADWGTFALGIATCVGLIGGCTSSSSGALSVFRVQITLAAIRARIRVLHAPHRIETVRYDGQTIDDDVLGPIILHTTSYILLLGVMTVLLSFEGVDLESSFFAVWTSIGNIGYGVGPMVVGTGTFAEFPDAAKWVLIVTMIMGRLGLLAGLVLLMPRFWQP